MKAKLSLLSILALSLSIACSTTTHQSPSDKMTSCQHTATAFNCVHVLEVYDGDTIFISLPDQHPLFGKRMGVRLMGIDTPEVRTANACEKKKALEAKTLLKTAIEGAKRVDIVDVQADKYFRILGRVLVDGKPVADNLVKAKLAYPYHGNKKPTRNWCE